MQTSLTVASCLYCLATNTEVQEKLRNEVREVVGKEQMVTSEHVQNMHYLRDCIKETMRLNMVYLITLLLVLMKPPSNGHYGTNINSSYLSHA